VVAPVSRVWWVHQCRHGLNRSLTAPHMSLCQTLWEKTWDGPWTASWSGGINLTGRWEESSTPSFTSFTHLNTSSFSLVFSSLSVPLFSSGWRVGPPLTVMNYPDFSGSFSLKINLEWPQFVYKLRLKCPNPGESLLGCAISTPLLYLLVLEIHKKVNFFFVFGLLKKFQHLNFD